MKELIEKNKQTLNQNRSQFRRVFGIELHRFMHPLFGFDAIRFDEWLGTPDGISTYDYIKETKGNEALTLVQGLV